MNEMNNVGADRLSRRMERGCTFLGSEVAIMAGAMSWVSERNLVAAMSNAGGFGVIACGAMTPALLDAEIAGTKALTDRPFGVNLITMHPALFELIEVCAKHGVGHVVLAGGLLVAGTPIRDGLLAVLRSRGVEVLTSRDPAAAAAWLAARRFPGVDAAALHAAVTVS